MKHNGKRSPSPSCIAPSAMTTCIHGKTGLRVAWSMCRIFDLNARLLPAMADGSRRPPQPKAWTSGVNPITQRSNTPLGSNGAIVKPQPKSSSQDSKSLDKTLLDRQASFVSTGVVRRSHTLQTLHGADSSFVRLRVSSATSLHARARPSRVFLLAPRSWAMTTSSSSRWFGLHQAVRRTKQSTGLA